MKRECRETELERDLGIDEVILPPRYYIKNGSVYESSSGRNEPVGFVKNGKAYGYVSGRGPMQICQSESEINF